MITLRSRSAIRSHKLLTTSTLGRLMPPLSPRYHASRVDPELSNRTAEPIFDRKGDKNSLPRSRGDVL